MLKLIANVSASSWHHSQGKVNKLMRRFGFYTFTVSANLQITMTPKRRLQWNLDLTNLYLTKSSI